MKKLIQTYWHDFWYSPEKAKVQLRVTFMTLGLVLTQVDFAWLPGYWPDIVKALGSGFMVISVATKAGEKNQP